MPFPDLIAHNSSSSEEDSEEDESERMERDGVAAGAAQNAKFVNEDPQAPEQQRLTSPPRCTSEPESQPAGGDASGN